MIHGCIFDIICFHQLFTELYDITKVFQIIVVVYVLILENGS